MNRPSPFLKMNVVVAVGRNAFLRIFGVLYQSEQRRIPKHM